MKTDLLHIYAENHLTSLYNDFIVVFIFLFSRLYMYGLPGSNYTITCVVFLAIGVTMLVRQKILYQEILAYHGERSDEELKTTVREIAVNKLCYMVPWLLIVFWPFSAHFQEHLLGYIFIICAIVFYVSASAPVFPLFVWDVSIQIVFAVAVTLLNQRYQESPYIEALIVLAGFIAVTGGRKINQFTIQLANKTSELEKSVKRAEFANRAKSEFLAVMSHEIRTPITGIMGMIDSLKETKLTLPQIEDLKTMSDCSKALLNTLNDVLDISQMEAGKLAINNTDFDFHAMLDNAIKIIRPAAADKNLVLDVSIAADVPRYIHSDPNRIQQIVNNFLNNAVKFTEKGSVTLDVSCHSEEGPVLRIAVKDTGIGISPEEQKNLFQKFSQADSSISRKYGGAGLGLSITKHLTELMGGTIGVVSEKGNGSLFWFEIPYWRAEAEAAAPAADIVADMPHDLNILLVEDNHVNQLIATRLLEKKGHHVTLAANGEAALRAVQREVYDIILMDINLPVKSGIETAGDIKALGDEYSVIPIIALTANALADQIQKCYEAGMVDHIIKPFSPQKLYAALSRHAPRAAMAAAETLGEAAPAADDISGKLQAIEEEFGPDYMAYLIRSGVGEIENLLAEIERADREQNYEALYQAAHDMKSVSGSIGLTTIHDQARVIEKRCLDRQYADISPLIRQLSQDCTRETTRLKNL